MALIVVSAIGTAALSPRSLGNASVQEPAPEAATQSISAQVSRASAQRQDLQTALQEPVPGSDNLLLAVLSLEASTTTSEVEASVERILALAVPQEPASPPQREDQAIEVVTQESEEPDSLGATAEEPACRETGSVAFCVYTVEEGDTLSAIAEELGFAGTDGISAAEMLAQSNKPDVISSDHIEPGQNIRVPHETGILHTVFSDETAGELADAYGASLDAILNSPYNGAGDGILLTGQEIFIPGPTRLPVNEEVELQFDVPEEEAALEPTAETVTEEVPEPEAAEPTEVPTEEPTTEPTPGLPPMIPQLGPLDTPTPTPEPTQEPTATPEPTDEPEEATEEEDEDAEEDPTPAPRQRSTGDGFFIWPVVGPISSYFGPSHPLGIDIDLYNDPNADIVAARDGTVVFAGGDACCSYGYYVIVEHENGIRTLYAHLSRISVSEGEEVSQGEVLGRAGRTGYATGNHLHFEIRVDGNVVDPLKYLP